MFREFQRLERREEALVSGISADRQRVAMHERLSRMLEEVGFPHTVARVYTSLVLAKGEGLSTSELVKELQVSKASVSHATQFLAGTQLVERYRVPGSREAHYRILKGVWGPILARKFAAIAYVRQAVDEAMQFTDSELAMERLEEMHDVYSFFEREFEQVQARWDERMGT